MTPEKRKEYLIKWRKEHPEKVQEYESRYAKTRQQYRQKHREKYKKYNEEYRKKHPEKFQRYIKKYANTRRNTTLGKKYGITTKDYDAMFLQQDGKCASCKRPQKEFRRRLHVDHDHLTGEVRGLLCLHCNHLVGLFERDPNCFENVKRFLKTSRNE